MRRRAVSTRDPYADSLQRVRPQPVPVGAARRPRRGQSAMPPSGPAPNGDLYNTRVAHSTISSTNVAKLGVAWTVPLPGKGTDWCDVANPVLADGIAYLQDAASNVTAVRYATGEVLWTHTYNSPENSGPNGVTIANGRIYGVTARGVFALDARTGRQVWYDTTSRRQAHFDMPPQVADGKVFVSSALTVGGGILYALDANTGATIWSFQTVADQIGQQLWRPRVAPGMPS